MEKSYNQRYKESNTTLSYKEWRKREDEKMASFDGVKPDFKDSTPYKSIFDTMKDKSGYQTRTSGKTVLGIRYNILIAAGLIIAGVVGYKLYKRFKK
jgi:hypothetical protein